MKRALPEGSYRRMLQILRPELAEKLGYLTKVQTVFAFRDQPYPETKKGTRPCPNKN